MKNYSVYLHVNPIKQEVFYVGLGNKDRPYITSRCNSHWTSIFNKYGCHVIIIHDNLTFKEACDLEIKYIAQIGRNDKGLGPLVNHTDGGEGKLGYKCTDEWKLLKSIEQSKIWTEEKKAIHSLKIKSSFKKNNSGQLSLHSRIKNGTLERSQEAKDKAKRNTSDLWKDKEYRDKVLAARQVAYSEGRGKRVSKLSSIELAQRKELYKERKNNKRNERNKTMAIEDLRAKQKLKRERAKLRKLNKP